MQMETNQSVIRLMTRLAAEQGAINLAQGFTDEAPPFELVWGALAALLGGEDQGIARLQAASAGGGGGREIPLRDLLASLQSPRDRLNQYSYPFGLPELREAIADYTNSLYAFRPDPETEITVVLGATEGVSTVLRALCSPGDAVVVVQPFHEMYPAQATVHGLHPRFVTLREDPDRSSWSLDPAELEAEAGDDARLLILNTPHNPTGKVFTRDELEAISQVCRRRDLLLITDEIYEHIVYDGHRHLCLAALPDMRRRTIVVNSISKTGNATGWRIGWVLSPPELTPQIRAIHDTLVIQAPTPLQKGVVDFLRGGHAHFAQLQSTYAAKRALLLEALRSVGFRCSAPEGSYYLFADYRQVPALGALGPREAALRLIEEVGVASVPGDNFYAEGKEGDRYLRFAFCRSLPSLREAADRLARHLRR